MNRPAFVDRVKTRLPRREMERRWALVRARLDEIGAEALVAFSNEDFLGGYVRWLTDRPSYYAYGTAVVFHRDEPLSLIEHGFMGTRRLMDGNDPDYPGVSELFQTSAFHSVRYTASYEADIVADILKDRRYARVALAGGDAMPHGFAASLAAIPGLVLTDDSDALDQLRAVKSVDEEAQIRATAQMQDRVFAKVLELIEPGIRDSDIMALIQAEGRIEGSEQAVIMIGSAPAGQPPIMRNPRYQNRRIERGDSVTVLIENNGAAGYYTELGRVVTVGKADPAFADAVQRMVVAQDRSAGKLVPGAACADVAREHDAYMTSLGHPPETRLFAHGQGYSLVERPLVRADETMSVAAGMNFAVHPTYADRQHFAYICDNFWVSGDGPPERLHATPRKLFEVDG